MAISRRGFLATGAVALGAVAAAGAAGGAIGVLRNASPEPFVAPVAPEALTRAVLREQTLLQGLAAAQTAHPELAAQLAPIIADHSAHLDVLGREWARITAATAVPGPTTLIDPGGAGPSGATGSASGSSSASPTVDPASPAAGSAHDAVAALRAGEQAAADAAGADCLGWAAADESDAQIAVLLGSISACETVHVEWLA